MDLKNIYFKKLTDSFTHKIVATEDSETKKSSRSEIKIFSKDLNDNSPIFKENEYTATIKENEGANDSVIRINATDLDVSPEFGQDSIRYQTMKFYYNNW